MKVQFIPHLADYIFITKRLSRSEDPPPLRIYCDYLFWIVNAIAIPAIFLLFEHFTIGFALFLFDLIYVLIYVNDQRSKDWEKQIAKRLAHLMDKPLTVELTNAGIVGTQNGNSSIVIWENVTEIVETEESVYFLFGHNGSYVRKEAFESPEKLNTFLDFARHKAHTNI